MKAERGGERAGPSPGTVAQACALALCVALLCSGCGGGRPHENAAGARQPRRAPATTVAARKTPNRASGSSLVIEARTEAHLTDNFNPFSTTSPLTQMSVPSYIYEPLVQYNELQVGQYYPWLATSWSFSSSGLTVTFDLRPGVKWADGSRFSAADVAYTFNLLKNNPGIDHGIPIVSAVATGPTTFVLTLSEPGYAYLYDIARVPIVKSGYAAAANPSTYADKSPDGTGPYTLATAQDFSLRRVVLTARAGYWQSGGAAIHQLVFPAYRDSAAVLSALRAGTLDWATSPLPDVVAQYVDKDKAHNHFWFPPVDCIALELNLAKGGLDKLAVRRAISEAINRDALSQQTENGFDLPATSASGLVLPTDSEFLLPSDTKNINDFGDPSAAARLMQGAGYHANPEGYWATAAGQVLELKIVDPAGTTFAAGAALVARQLRSAGFDATAHAVTVAKWGRDLAVGNFDGSIMASASGPAPFYMYENWLDPAMMVRGHASGGDYVRLSLATDPSLAATVVAQLDNYTDSPSGSAGAQAAIEVLANVVSKDLPVVPLMYGVAWGEFSTRHATGWPSAQNAYEPAIPKAPFAEYTVLQLSPS